MKIRNYSDKMQDIDKRKQELQEILRQPSDTQQRPCSSCYKLCGCEKRSSNCTCECSIDCPDTSRYLSSDPEQYPIEPKVVPLVYTMATLRLAPPCWSCEGHIGANGDLVRLPQVWFYSATTVYPELISKYLTDLSISKKVKYRWVVTVCPHTASDVTTFLINPEIPAEIKLGKTELWQMQADLQAISFSLREGIFQVARNKLSRVEQQEKLKNTIRNSA